MTVRILPKTAGKVQGTYSTTLASDGVGGATKSYLPLTGLQHGGFSNQGVRVDCHTGTVAVFSTNIDYDTAIHPSTTVQGGISWKSEGTATPGTPVILTNSVVGTLRFDFTATASTVTVTSL